MYVDKASNETLIPQNCIAKYLPEENSTTREGYNFFSELKKKGRKKVCNKAQYTCACTEWGQNWSEWRIFIKH